MIFEALDKIRRNAIFTTILLMALGAIIMICPANYIPTLILGTGYTLVVVGLVMGFGFFSSKKSLVDYIKFVGAILLAIAGILVLVKRDEMMSVLAWVFGLLLFIDGLRTLLHSVTYVRRSHRKAWILLFIFSLAISALGVILFITPWFNPWFSSAETLMKAIGGTILIAAVVSLCRLILTWPFKEKKEVTDNGKA